MKSEKTEHPSIREIIYQQINNVDSLETATYNIKEVDFILLGKEKTYLNDEKKEIIYVKKTNQNRGLIQQIADYIATESADNTTSGSYYIDLIDIIVEFPIDESEITVEVANKIIEKLDSEIIQECIFDNEIFDICLALLYCPNYEGDDFYIKSAEDDIYFFLEEIQNNESFFYTVKTCTPYLTALDLLQGECCSSFSKDKVTPYAFSVAESQVEKMLFSLSLQS